MGSVARGIDLLLQQTRMTELVAAYFDRSAPFAGHLFDTIGDNRPDQFGEDDLLAVTLLDVSYGPSAVRELLQQGQRWSSLLSEIPSTMTLWEIDRRTYEAADALWRHLVALPGVGPTKAGKLLARKRPALIPIYDDVIAAFLRPGERGLWWDLYDALQDSGRRARIDELANGLMPTPTTLRLIDVAVWMRCGNSVNARHARVAAGCPAQPLTR
jgi:hypothetical protein